jgi:hypothetical protein
MTRSRRPKCCRCGSSEAPPPSARAPAPSARTTRPLPHKAPLRLRTCCARPSAHPAAAAPRACRAARRLPRRERAGGGLGPDPAPPCSVVSVPSLLSASPSPPPPHPALWYKPDAATPLSGTNRTQKSPPSSPRLQPVNARYLFPQSLGHRNVVRYHDVFLHAEGGELQASLRPTLPTDPPRPRRGV